LELRDGVTAPPFEFESISKFGKLACEMSLDWKTLHAQASTLDRA
jgi:hypothetical protein